MDPARPLASPPAERLAAGEGVPWFDPLRLLPKRDQSVRVLTRSGTDHRATFAVAYTAQWPEGASWVLPGDRPSLAFHDVVLWSPDPMARPPSDESDEADAGPPPAIAAEAETEVVRTADVLRLVPTEHLDWAPHPDLASPRTLSRRLIAVASRMDWILDLDEIDLAFQVGLPDLGTADALYTTYQATADDVRRRLRALDAEALRAPWTLLRDGQPVAQTPRGDALRTFGITPLVHTRAELAQILRTTGARPPHPCPTWPFADGPAHPEVWAHAA